MLDYYLIRDWTDTNATQGGGYTNGPPPCEVVCGVKDLLACIGDAKEKGRQIAVYLLAECLLDWS
jgi:hypothetical protein